MGRCIESDSWLSWLTCRNERLIIIRI
ncbi:Protein of unknown function [Bacillus mycoides]|nr:Protein of unknown function [Bacillus mycoides]